jgi:hypothetical protein
MHEKCVQPVEPTPRMRHKDTVAEGSPATGVSGQA